MVKRELDQPDLGLQRLPVLLFALTVGDRDDFLPNRFPAVGKMGFDEVIISMKITFIAWTRYERRSELLAKHLGGSMHFIYFWRDGNPLAAPFRYFIQGLQTIHVLFRERPGFVFVQNPPVFCALVVYVFGKFFQSRFILDSHTAAFLSRRWGRFLWLHRWLAKRAFLSIVHNRSQEAIIRDWNCPYLVIGFAPGDYPPGEPFLFTGAFNLAVPCTFHDDEPIDIIFEAARRLPNVHFYFTGDFRHLSPELVKGKPGNCHLTGFLNYGQYIGLLRGADAILDLTTRDGTVLSGAFEAISLGKPLIVSDWQVLRNYFSAGTVYVPNSVDGICNGVSHLQSNMQELSRGIVQLQAALNLEWRQNFAKLMALLSEGL